MYIHNVNWRHLLLLLLGCFPPLGHKSELDLWSPFVLHRETDPCLKYKVRVVRFSVDFLRSCTLCAVLCCDHWGRVERGQRRRSQKTMQYFVTTPSSSSREHNIWLHFTSIQKRMSIVQQRQCPSPSRPVPQVSVPTRSSAFDLHCGDHFALSVVTKAIAINSGQRAEEESTHVLIPLPSAMVSLFLWPSSSAIQSSQANTIGTRSCV